MNKILSICVILLVVWGAVNQIRVGLSRNKVEKLENQMQTLKQTIITKDIQIERSKNAERESNRTIKRLREIKEQNTQAHAWSSECVPAVYVEWLRARHNRPRSD